MKLIFRGRLWRGTHAAIGETVKLFDCSSQDALGETVTNAWGIWEIVISSDSTVAPYYIGGDRWRHEITLVQRDSGAPEALEAASLDARCSDGNARG